MQSSNSDIQHQDRVFVFRSMETLETYSLLNLQAWYRVAINIIAANIKQNRGRTQRGRNRRGNRVICDVDNPAVVRDY